MTFVIKKGYIEHNLHSVKLKMQLVGDMYAE